MKFVVCVKQVPATNEARIDPVTGSLMREGIASILNPFDAYAVEEALRLRALLGGDIAAISMGVPAAQEMLRGLLALGVDRAALLTDRAFAGADTLATARALKLGVEKLGNADLLLLGKMATDGDTAQVGPMLAELLGIPHIADVSRVVSLSEREIEVEKLTDDGYLRLSSTLPALLTVVKEINVPRLPSIAGVLAAEGAEIERWNAGDVGANPAEVGLKGSATRVVKSWRPERKMACEFLPDANALLERLGLRKNALEQTQEMTGTSGAGFSFAARSRSAGVAALRRAESDTAADKKTSRAFSRIPGVALEQDQEMTGTSGGRIDKPSILTNSWVSRGRDENGAV